MRDAQKPDHVSLNTLIAWLKEGGVVTSKLTWVMFEDRFVNKEALATKFGQLADLRNGIRHSRAVDEITRKEGEAAVLWFSRVLGKGVRAIQASGSLL